MLVPEILQEFVTKNQMKDLHAVQRISEGQDAIITYCMPFSD